MCDSLGVIAIAHLLKGGLRHTECAYYRLNERLDLSLSKRRFKRRVSIF